MLLHFFFTLALKDLIYRLVCALWLDCSGRPSRCRRPGSQSWGRRRRCIRQ